jgi:6-pyruvoyltetrahydropterin/6-carboxytetrahydropterin synthase
MASQIGDAMSLVVKSTKSFHKLATAHLQWQDTDATGTPGSGPCAKWHGYDRSVTLEFSGIPDQHGWIVGFGDLKPVRAFLEFYFDHTAIAPASDPRMADILAARDAGIVDLRVLPYGVSMEMSALFIWEQVNPFIANISNNRAWVSRVESREHDSNSAFVEVDETTAKLQIYENRVAGIEPLIKQAIWGYASPASRLQAFATRAMPPIPPEEVLQGAGPVDSFV